MRRLLTWLAGGLGVAALLRELLRRPPAFPPAPPPSVEPDPAEPDAADPAEELRAKLEQAREAPDDRDEFDAAEGTAVDAVEVPRGEARPEAPPVSPAPPAAPEPEAGDDSLDERRRAVHDKAQEALGHMRGATDDD